VPVVATAICPHPPLLVPELAAGAAAELDELRAACRAAVDALRESSPDLIVVVGEGAAGRWHEPGEHGSLQPWGVAATGQLGAVPNAGGRAGSLPLSLTIGGWLLGPVATRVSGRSVRADTGPDDCVGLGRAIAARAARVGLLVMGDGTACRSEKAPGYYDPRAQPFDAAVAATLAAGDPEGLLKVDPILAADLRCAGRAPWQVLAGAAAGARGLSGRLRHQSAPNDVSYLVASWAAAGPDAAAVLAG
jgi:hypothetical protein